MFYTTARVHLGDIMLTNANNDLMTPTHRKCILYHSTLIGSVIGSNACWLWQGCLLTGTCGELEMLLILIWMVITQRIQIAKSHRHTLKNRTCISWELHISGKYAHCISYRSRFLCASVRGWEWQNGMYFGCLFTSILSVNHLENTLNLVGTWWMAI